MRHPHTCGRGRTRSSTVERLSCCTVRISRVRNTVKLNTSAQFFPRNSVADCGADQKPVKIRHSRACEIRTRVETRTNFSRTIDWGGWSPCFRPHEAYALLTEGDTGGAIGAGSHTSHRGDAVAGRESPTSGPLSGERLFGRPVLNTCCSQAWTGESAAIGLVSTIPCDIDWGAAVLLACVGISRCCGGGRWALRAGRRRCAMLLRTCRGCVLWWCGSRLYNVNGGLRARTLLQAAVGRRSAVCMRVVGFDLLRARTRSHIRLCYCADTAASHPSPQDQVQANCRAAEDTHRHLVARTWSCAEFGQTGDLLASAGARTVADHTDLRHVYRHSWGRNMDRH